MRILIFQHLDIETPGVFRDFWRGRRHVLTTSELDGGTAIPDLEEFDLLAVMGGPMDVWQKDVHPWLALEKAAIRQWVKYLEKPYFGICLGHQLLAEALGGEVALMQKPEVGLVDIHLTPAGQADRIFSDFPPTFQTLQWHSAEVSRMPEGGHVLARNKGCAVQAFKWGKWAFGFQYHTEIGPEAVSEWGRIPEYRASLEAVVGPKGAENLEGVVAPKLAELRAAAKRLDDNLHAIISAG